MLTLTPLRVLFATAVIGAVTTWTLLRTWAPDSVTLASVPWPVPLSLTLVAAMVLAMGLNLRRRLRGDPMVRAYEPLEAARLVALAKASAYAGSVLVGLYAGVVVALVLDFDLGRSRETLFAALSLAAATLVAAAGLIVERICQVKPPDDEQPLSSS